LRRAGGTLPAAPPTATFRAGRRRLTAAAEVAVILPRCRLGRWISLPLDVSARVHGVLPAPRSAATAATTASSGAATREDDRIAVAQTRRTRRDDAIAFGDAVQDFRARVAFDADLHRMERRDVVDREVHASRAIGVDQRVGRHHQRVACDSVMMPTRAYIPGFRRY